MYTNKQMKIKWFTVWGEASAEEMRRCSGEVVRWSSEKKCEGDESRREREREEQRDCETFLYSQKVRTENFKNNNLVFFFLNNFLIFYFNFFKTFIYIYIFWKQLKKHKIGCFVAWQWDGRVSPYSWCWDDKTHIQRHRFDGLFASRTTLTVLAWIHILLQKGCNLRIKYVKYRKFHPITVVIHLIHY